MVRLMAVALLFSLSACSSDTETVKAIYRDVSENSLEAIVRDVTLPTAEYIKENGRLYLLVQVTNGRQILVSNTWSADKIAKELGQRDIEVYLQDECVNCWVTRNGEVTRK